tara:strand:- start:2 stop:1183 length:1182 start_codon:yes stop_codon:yes gene_type:complete
MKLQVVSPWYPDRYTPYAGEFVHSQVKSFLDKDVDVRVEVPKVFSLPDHYVSQIYFDAFISTARKNPDSVFFSNNEATFIPCLLPTKTNPIKTVEAFKIGIKMKRDFLPSEFDLVHAHLALPTGLAASRLSDKPLIITEHQSGLEKLLSSPKLKEAYLEAIESADAFICVSDFLKENLVDVYGSRISQMIEIVPNLVDFNSFNFVHREKFESLSWLYVGSFFRHKGVMKLLKTFAAYKKYVAPSATLTLIGTGPLLPWVERFCKRKGIRQSVFLPGAQPHGMLRNYFAKADLLVHLSEQETFGIVSLEAIASGVPVVSFHNGGSDFTWKNISELCGRLIDKNSNEQDIIETIIDLSDHSEDLDLFKARSKLEERFSSDVVSNQLFSIYKKVLA